MDLWIRDKSFVVVGGTTGMGFAAATELARDGANVALLARDGKRAQERAAALARDHGVRAIGIAADGTSRDGSLAQAVAEAESELGSLRGLAVTAGPMNQQGPFLEHEDDSWDWYYEVILMMTVRACRAVIPFPVLPPTAGKLISESAAARQLSDSRIPVKWAIRGSTTGFVESR